MTRGACLLQQVVERQHSLDASQQLEKTGAEPIQLNKRQVPMMSEAPVSVVLR